MCTYVGDADAVVVHHSSGQSSLAWQANDGSGAFATSYTYMANPGDLSGEISSVCSGDLDNDGDVDFLAIGVGVLESYNNSAGDGSAFTTRYGQEGAWINACMRVWRCYSLATVRLC